MTKSTTDLKNRLVNESIAKTIGSGKDFKTLENAFEWLENAEVTAAEIAFLLDNGTHVLKREYILSYDSFTLISVSSDRELCTVRFEGLADYSYCFNTLNSSMFNDISIETDNNLSVVLRANNNAICKLYNVKVSGGYYNLYSNSNGIFEVTTVESIDAKVSHVNLQNNSHMQVSNFTMTDTLDAATDGVQLFDSSVHLFGNLYATSLNKKMKQIMYCTNGSNVTTADDVSITFDNMSTYGMRFTRGATFNDGYNTSYNISNCPKGINAETGAQVYLGINEPVFTNVTTGYNIETNIMLDAETLISVGSIELTKSSSSGDTASRPALPNINNQYFDTDLDKPVWFNGTDWVDVGARETVSTLTEKTVGTGKDFETLHEGLIWAESVDIINIGEIRFTIDDGTHLLKSRDTADFYTFKDSNISFYAAEGASANCTISVDPTDTNTSWMRLFKLSNTRVYMLYVDINITAGSTTYSDYITIFDMRMGSSVTAQICTFSNSYKGFYLSDSTIQISHTSIFDNFSSNCVQAVSGTVSIDSSTISNSNLGIYIAGSNFSGVNANINNVTFINNVEDTDIPINEIDYSGCYIADGTESLYHKGNEIINTYTTKTVGIGKDFELLHDALRWAEGLTLGISGRLLFVLDDGVHTITRIGEVDANTNAYYNFSRSHITLRSASGSHTACILSIKSDSDIADYSPVIYIEGGVFSLEQISADLTSDGYVGGNLPSLVFASALGYTYINGGTYTGWYSVTSMYHGSFLSAQSATIDNCNAAFIATNSRVETGTGLSIINSTGTGAISVVDGGITLMKAPVTFSSNVSDTNIPLNEIQYNGSYISDNTAALSFKA